MQFDSLTFLLFLPVSLALYWLVSGRNVLIQNALMLAAGVFFYVWADWRFLAILLGNAFVTYYAGLLLTRTLSERKGRLILIATVVLSLSTLLFFKYFNFLASAITEVGQVFSGNEAAFRPLKIMLPLGISFFTFQTLGYVIDIYYGRIQRVKSLFDYLVYVTYFPKILAGPIERAQNFMPQISNSRTFSQNMAVEGMRQILWGFFKKIVIADNCAIIVNQYFNTYQDQSGSTLVMGLFFYMFQIYCDFSGYTDIALGTSRLFGITLMKNFNYPYFCTSIGDFWRRWHISLSTWMMDYLYTPLSFYFRSYRKAGTIISILITFIMVGLWHGPNLTFVVFGLLHGLYFIPVVFFGDMRSPLSGGNQENERGLIYFGKIAGMFLVLMFTSLFFRAENLGQAAGYLSAILARSLISVPDLSARELFFASLIIVLIIVEWIGRRREFALAWFSEKLPVYIRWPLYYLLIFLIFFFREGSQQFIYFQF